ncbi:hypothetical protein QN277_029439 [Acacia crassicarpa]|uniref:Uncharacterized protein n=1 Tax=Acacia crassicarpa TaxID=499986 RepID=A0AAE1J5K8_9FABA|nr:hypothetical protein QN277_029439 [Acacia crassicarpa]
MLLEHNTHIRCVFSSQPAPMLHSAVCAHYRHTMLHFPFSVLHKIISALILIHFGAAQSEQRGLRARDRKVGR